MVGSEKPTRMRCWEPGADFDYEEDCGYLLNSPKHPTFRERMSDYAYFTRKSRRETALSERGATGPVGTDDLRPGTSDPRSESAAAVAACRRGRHDWSFDVCRHCLTRRPGW
jgi:hypothetical protein